MIPFLRNLQIDRLSFWLGFIAGSLFWLLLVKARPLLALLRNKMKERATITREKLFASVEVRFGNDTLAHVQKLHLAAPLFALEEILIQPYLLAPPPMVEPGSQEIQDENIENAVPYLPDWPELGAVYKTKIFTLAEGLQGGANLILMGRPGSGKTVTLAHLTTLMVRKDPSCNELNNLVPVYIHAADLVLSPQQPNTPPLTVLVGALNNYTSPLTQSRLPAFIKDLFESGRVLLLLDGLDELPTKDLQETVNYLSALTSQFPGLRAVAAASPYQVDGLASLGYTPLAMAAWDKRQSAAFIQQWGVQWHKFVNQPGQEELVDPALINGWLLTDVTPLNPLELTLKVWAAYAGDMLGPEPWHGIEAYLRRMTVGTAKGYQALAFLAAQMVSLQQLLVTRKEVEKIIADFEAGEGGKLTAFFSQPEDKTRQASSESITISRVLPPLIENGLLTQHPGSRLIPSHPVITGYLAGVAVEQPEAVDRIALQPEWTGKDISLYYRSIHAKTLTWLDKVVKGMADEPLQIGTLKAARWLREADPNAPWRTLVLRQLFNILQLESNPMPLRARALAALVFSRSNGVGIALRQSLGSRFATLRQLAVLGCGILQETKATGEIVNLFADSSLDVRRAACLALVAIGDKSSLETVASALFKEDEELRRMAAEALANNPDEGIPTLVEGTTIDDVEVRRAAIFGLARIHEPWVVPTLEKIQAEDKQWVVQNAAAHILEIVFKADPHVPRPLSALTETPWLIAYAGELGIGVAPGKPAFDLLLRAAKDGNEEQKLAAFQYISHKPFEDAISLLYQTIFTARGEIQDAAFEALWYTASSGIPVPPPIKFGINV